MLISFYRGTLASQSFEHSKRTLLSFCCLFVVSLLSLCCLLVVSCLSLCCLFVVAVAAAAAAAGGGGGGGVENRLPNANGKANIWHVVKPWDTCSEKAVQG